MRNIRDAYKHADWEILKKEAIWKSRRTSEDNIKQDLQEGRSEDVECIYLAQDRIQGCFEHSNKPSISINDREFFDYQRSSRMVLLYGISDNCKVYIV
jgi:hypothetical protein